ncbi:MAG: serine protease [Betaproteobacteria bacterium]|nr:serine protease [Betaproteobacteria bacterium]
MKQAIFFTSLIASWRLRALILLLIALVACLPRAQAQSLEQTRRIMQSVVALQVSADPESPSSRSLGPQRIGTGVVIGENLILTVGYLLIEAEDIDVLDHQQRRLPASVAAYDPASGFGLVKTLVPLKLQAIRMGDSDGLKLPRRLLTLGQSEKELTELFLVSRKPYAGNWEYLVDAPLMTIPAVNNWSGAGLFDDEGALIGIGSLVVADATGGFNPRPGNLYLPINLLKPILEDLLANGRRSGPAQAWLGIHSQEHPEGGLQIQRLSPDGPAALAGLQRGDRILALDSTAITGLSDFYRRLWAKGPAGSRVELTLLRDGVSRKVQITSGDRLAAMRKPKGV